MTIPLLMLVTLAFAPVPVADPVSAIQATSVAAAAGSEAASESWPVDRLPIDAREFYPVHPGDTWTYESSARGRFTNQVADSLRSDGAVVHRIRSMDASGRKHTFKVRRDGSRLYIGPDLESLALLSDFGLEVGASSPTRWGTQEATLTLAGRHDTLEVFGTRFDDIVEVHIMTPGGGRLTYFFARGIGMVGMESDHPDTHVRLVTATVDGRTIPVSTSSPEHDGDSHGG